MQITVVGAGVVGLVTALTLEERGHDVRVVAATSGDATTSAVAGAVWVPYRVGPPDKVVRWAARTRAWLEELARTAPEAGVDVLAGYEILAGDAPPWWADAVPELSRAPAPVAGAPLAWHFVAPRAQPAIILPWLVSRLRRPIERRTVTELAAEPGDAVIDCTGLAARDLAGDPSITGLFGQTVIVAPGGVDLRVTITDDRDPDAIFYVIPRRDELVLGGCSRPYPLAHAPAPGTSPPLDPALGPRILGQARALGLPIGPVLRERAGLRPFRPTVRLERDPDAPRVIHHYGHGGAGYTLARGCAEDVAALLEAST